MKAPLQRVVEEYDSLAGTYDRRWARYVRLTAEETAHRIVAAPGSAILDVGCGTGVLLDRLAHRDPECQLSGVDPSTNMLAVARDRLPRGTTLLQGVAESLPQADKTFDVVVSNSAFHYFASPADALREMVRVLRPGGSLVITDWCGDYLACKLCERWLRLTSSTPVRILGAKLCQAALASAGLVELRIERYKIDLLWGLMTVTARKPQ